MTTSPLAGSGFPPTPPAGQSEPPDGSDTIAPEGDIVKRAQRACDHCRQRKIRCDGVKPACDNCKHAGVPCTFIVPHRSKKRKLDPRKEITQLKATLERRIDTLEQLIQKKIAPTTTPPVPQSSQVNVPTSIGDTTDHGATTQKTYLAAHDTSLSRALFKQHLESCKIGDVDACENFSFFSEQGQRWLEDHTGEKVNFQQFLPDETTANYGNPPFVAEFATWTAHLGKGRVLGPLDKSLVDDCAEVHFSSVLHSIMPVLDQTTFSKTVEAVCSGQPHSAGARALVQIFPAFFARFHGTNHYLTPEDEEACVLGCLALFPDVMRETLSVDSVQAMLMFALYQSLCGNMQFFEILLMATIRIVVILGGHLCPSPAVSNSHLRILFWLCYSLDKDVSLRIGRPPYLRDDECDLDFPSFYSTPEFSQDGSAQPSACPTCTSTPVAASSPSAFLFPSTLNTACPSQKQSPSQPCTPSQNGSHQAHLSHFFPTDLRLAILKSNIFRLLYSASALRAPDAELLRSIRELDAELDDWKATLPPSYRPARAEEFCRGGHLGVVPDHVALSLRGVMLHLEYYHCMATIHRASTRCRAWASHEGFTSSVALCVEASRSTILYLEATRYLLGTEAYWITVYYPVSSLLTIFCHFLKDPLASSAAADFQLITRGPDAVEELLKATSSPTRQHGASAKWPEEDYGPFGGVHRDSSHFRLLHTFMLELRRLAECALAKAKREKTQEVYPL